MQVTIYPHFQDLIPALSENEYDSLTESIRTDGIRDKLIVWLPSISAWRQISGNNKSTNEDIVKDIMPIMIDGHNRYHIATQLGIDIPDDMFTEKEFETVEDAEIWIIKNQLARRNLTDAQRDYMIGERYRIEKKRSSHEGGGSTADRIGEEFGMSGRNVINNEEFANNLDKVAETLGDETKADILSGKKKTTKKNVADAAKSETPEETAAALDANNRKPKQTHETELERFMSNVRDFSEYVNDALKWGRIHDRHRAQHYYDMERMYHEKLKDMQKFVRSLQTMAECPCCHGSGVIDDHKCDYCGGEKQVSAILLSEFGKPVEQTEEEIKE